jgi:methyl-accepting chemotaxis protein PixJ
MFGREEPTPQDAEMEVDETSRNLETLQPEADETSRDLEDRKLDNSLPPENVPSEKTKKVPIFILEGLSLKTKVKAFAIAFSTIPILGIGLGAYFSSSASTMRQIEAEKQNRVTQLAKDVDRFFSNRFGDIQTLAQQPSLNDPQAAALASDTIREKIFNNYVDAYKLYSGAAFFDLQGNPIAKNKGKALVGGVERKFLQNVLDTEKTTIGEPILDRATNTFYLNIATPVKERGTGTKLGIVVLQMPLDRIREAFESYTENSNEYHLIDAAGKLFLSPHDEEIAQPASQLFPQLAELKTSKGATFAYARNSEGHKANDGNDRILLSYAPVKNVAGVENLNMDVALGSNAEITLANQNTFLTTIGAATVITVLLAALAANFLADYATLPLLRAAEAVSKIGRGELDTRLEVAGDDEVAILSRNLNSMVEEMQKLITENDLSAQQKATTEEFKRREEQNQVLQMGLLNFLDQVQEVANGDLTVRAQITEDDIGIVADFFNSIIENLRELVTQVKSVAAEVNYTVAENEGAIAKLATNELEQAESIVQTLGLVEKMTASIVEVAGNAKVAADVARNASQNAAAGVKAIEGTVTSITELSETVEATVQKVKRLNDASGRISKVVRLIDEIAMKTKYLAVNAGIEASRAGEEARGFVVVAEQVGLLAASSASATQEIQQIVASIQQETAEVLGAMQAGNTKVQEGAQLVTKAKRSLSQIFTIAQQIDDLVQFISQAAVSQTNTSQQVKESMSAIAQVSTKNSKYSREVSDSLKYSVTIANQLKQSVNNFKVKEQA